MRTKHKQTTTPKANFQNVRLTADQTKTVKGGSGDSVIIEEVIQV